MNSTAAYHDCLEYFGPDLSVAHPFPHDEWAPPAVVSDLLQSACLLLLVGAWARKLTASGHASALPTADAPARFREPLFLFGLGLLLFCVSGYLMAESLLAVVFYWTFLSLRYWSIACYLGYLKVRRTRTTCSR